MRIFRIFNVDVEENYPLTKQQQNLIYQLKILKNPILKEILKKQAVKEENGL